MRKGSFLSKLRPVTLGSAMADLALLLLVFFMASTTTEPPKGVEVFLPVGTTQGAEQDSLYVTIARNGDIYFDGKIVDFEELHDNLAIRGGEKDRPVAITADRDLDYASISQVLGILQEQDFLNVVFMSEPRESGVTKR